MAKKPVEKNRSAIQVNRSINEDQDEAIAKSLTRPEVLASITIQTIEAQTDVNALNKVLSQQTDAILKGDMSRTESMLISQAHTLDALFNSLVKKGIGSKGLAQYEMMFRLALKAQSQCRSTLESLANIKNPPVIYAKQANITNGHQQINNGVTTQQGTFPTTTRTHAGTRENNNLQNELLEHTYGERLDT